MELISTHSPRLWHCREFIYRIFSKATQPFDFIKPNLIQKLTYKVKCISQRRFGHVLLEIQENIFKLVGLIVNNMERINTRKRNTINSSVSKLL